MRPALVLFALWCWTLPPESCLAQSAVDPMNEAQDQADMDLNTDPNLVNVPNRQGYGRHDPIQDMGGAGGRGGGRDNKDGRGGHGGVSSGGGGGRGTTASSRKGGGSKKKDKTGDDESFGYQTKQAIFQFGVLVGVSLLVAGLFFLNVGLEVAVEKLMEKMSEMFGQQKTSDIEEQDPAALVGTFKRYK